MNNFPVIGIAASTGGPQAIRILIESPSFSKISAAFVIVQHMPDEFMRDFGHWLAVYSPIPVILPEDKENIERNKIYIAPGENHLLFKEGGDISLLDSPPVRGIRPSADLMLGSLGEIFRERAIAVILTGMGNDGTDGLYKIKKNKGHIVSQNSESSLIYGMPKSAIETGLVDKVVDIVHLSDYLAEYCGTAFREK